MIFEIDKSERKNDVHRSEHVLSYDISLGYEHRIEGFREHNYIADLDETYCGLVWYMDSINKPTNAFFDPKIAYELVDSMKHLRDLIYTALDDQDEEWSCDEKSILYCMELLYYFFEDISPHIVELCVQSFRCINEEHVYDAPVVHQFNVPEFSKNCTSLSKYWKRSIDELVAHSFNMDYFCQEIKLQMRYFFLLARNIYKEYVGSPAVFNLNKCLAILYRSKCKYRKIYEVIIKYFDCFYTFNIVKH